MRLRAGRVGAEVLGMRQAAASTVGTFLRAFTSGHASQVDAVQEDLHPRAWAACARPARVARLDPPYGEGYGPQSRAGRPTSARWRRTGGTPPMLPSPHSKITHLDHVGVSLYPPTSMRSRKVLASRETWWYSFCRRLLRGGQMNDQIRPEEAARALTEIGQRQEQVIRLAVIPNWYWWAIAVLMVAFVAAVDTRQGPIVGIGTAVFVAGVLTTTGRVVFRAVCSAQPRNDLLGSSGVVAILGFVAVTVGLSLAVAFILKASGVPYAATIAVSVTAVILMVG